MVDASVYSTLSTTSLVITPLPGPDRKRTVRPYLYRVAYRHDEPEEPGCLMLLMVDGGREEYQVALERTEEGQLQWHCTCPDAIYRGESEGKTCKHVKGILAVGRPTAGPGTPCSDPCEPSD